MPLPVPLQEETPFVLFVGAGASAMPPSSLPTWKPFNTLVLTVLLERLDRFAGGRQPTDAVLRHILAGRDDAGFFSPDFQAQLMEEEVGEAYFAVWRSLEDGVPGPAHHAIAELAARDRLRAIVTTNFDRLIEAALERRGVAFRVFHDAKAYDDLRALGARPDGAVPLIKIHGSLEDSASMVDTLRQRVAGRPPALQQVLDDLLRESVWLYVGFSGADFAYDEDYLNVRPLAAESKGFAFLVRAGEDPLPAVVRLARLYGPERATLVQGDLTNWLQATFGLPQSPPVEADDTAPAPSGRVRAGIEAWADTLDRIAVVNIVHGMLRSLGREREAFWLMRRTWKSYRQPEDQETPGYARYMLNYGLALLNAGRFTSEVALEEDWSNLLEWKEAADLNAVEYLGRAAKAGVPAAGAWAAAAMALRGEVAKAFVLAGMALGEAESAGELAYCEALIAVATVWDVMQEFSEPIRLLGEGAASAHRLGDEPRRAALLAHLGRFLVYGGRFDQAAEVLEQALSIAERLGLERTARLARAARGLLLCDAPSDDIDARVARAVEELQDLADALQRDSADPLFMRLDAGGIGESAADAGPREPQPVKGRDPLLCRVLLDLNRAAMTAGNQAVMLSSIEAVEEIAVEQCFGYVPHCYISHAQCLMVHGTPAGRADVPGLLDHAERVAREQGNVWGGAMVEHLRSQLSSAAPA